MNTDFREFLENAKTLADIFAVVKAAVVETLGMSRGGLMLGLADLENYLQGYFGAFYPVGDNIIIMNKTPLKRIRDVQPDLHNPYAFHVLLHEYLHTLGYIGVAHMRKRSCDIAKTLFGRDHLVF